MAKRSAAPAPKPPLPKRVAQGRLADDGAGWEEIGFRGPQVCRVVGISYRQLDYWARTGLLRPSLADAQGSGTQRRYSYRDLVALKVIKSLLDAGVSLQTARKAIEYLRAHLGEEVASASLVLNGARSVLARTGEDIVDLVRHGQGVLNIVPLGPMVEELDARLLELEPAEPEPEATRRRVKAAGGG
jgi:DNA-binding transcriptional MerR regulator